MLVCVRWMLAATVCLAAAGCREKNTPPPTSCAALESHVAKLYAGETYDLPKDGTTGPLKAELDAANVAMVLADCNADPTTRIRCIHEAKSVKELEANCVVIPDDEGLLEQKQFGR